MLSAIEHYYPTADLNVLDVGCGNGRFASFLAKNLPSRRERLRYLGIDASTAMLERAGAVALPFASTEYRLWDLVNTPLQEGLSSRTFSLTVLFGLLHHVPGAARRRALIRDAADGLRPGGLLAFTCWQFERIERFRAEMKRETERGEPNPREAARGARARFSDRVRDLSARPPRRSSLPRASRRRGRTD